MRTSEVLEQGAIYTRLWLRERFEIEDATINTGVFRPRGHDSVWLFITVNKTSDRTQYFDHLDGDVLTMEGQTQGRTDSLIVNHAQNDLELLLFYRESKSQYLGAGFRYEGAFRYESHTGSQPARFVLVRDDSIDESVARDLDAFAAEESYQEGRASKVLTNWYERDRKLRAAVVRLQGTQCLACGFSFEEAYGDHGKGFIEVHHLRPLSTYDDEATIDPEADMAVLCANCHRMVHRKPKTPLTIEALKVLVERYRKRTAESES